MKLNQPNCIIKLKQQDEILCMNFIERISHEKDEVVFYKSCLLIMKRKVLLKESSLNDIKNKQTK